MHSSFVNHPSITNKALPDGGSVLLPMHPAQNVFFLAPCHPLVPGSKQKRVLFNKAPSLASVDAVQVKQP